MVQELDIFISGPLTFKGQSSFIIKNYGENSSYSLRTAVENEMELDKQQNTESLKKKQQCYSNPYTSISVMHIY
jgi:hypothetical protein